MKILLKKFLIKLTLFLSFFTFSYSFADNHNVKEVLEKIQNDIKTLEKAVYSESVNLSSSVSNNLEVDINDNSEDVLTRHLLKLSEIENQFQQLTNKFE